LVNSGTTPYTTCYDAVVVAAGTGRGAGGLATMTVTDGLGGSSGTSTCTTQWASANSAASITATTPATATSTGTQSTTAVSNATVPLSGDSLEILSAPKYIGTSGSFTVTVAWSVTGSRVITVDILRNTDLNWYGKGTYSVTAVGTSQAAITVTVNDAQTYGAPVLGNTMILRAWLVSAQVFADYEAQLQLPVGQRDAVKSQPVSHFFCSPHLHSHTHTRFVSQCNNSGPKKWTVKK
jgi:hypothetical protein